MKNSRVYFSHVDLRADYANHMCFCFVVIDEIFRYFGRLGAYYSVYVLCMLFSFR